MSESDGRGEVSEAVLGGLVQPEGVEGGVVMFAVMRSPYRGKGAPLLAGMSAGGCSWSNSLYSCLLFLQEHVAQHVRRVVEEEYGWASARVVRVSASQLTILEV